MGKAWLGALMALLVPAMAAAQGISRAEAWGAVALPAPGPARIIGGTGRYAGATGDFAFSWRFVLEAEDGTVQGQSLGFKGRIRVGPQAAAGAGARP